MFKQSPSRTQRSRGIRVKHVLQICLLLAICFWLLFQVKHSHDKKKEYDEDDVKISQQTRSSKEVVKLGRKDLDPRLEDTTTTAARSQEEEAEEENAGEEEEIKLEEDNAEGNKFEEKGDELGGVGDDDVDEREEDKLDAEVDREEDVIEEEKEKEEGEKESEEKDSGDSDGQLDESSVDEHEDDEQAHEAREEHYKADDASSEVAAENENGNLEKPNELSGANIVGNEQVVNNNTNDNNVGEQTHYKAEDASSAVAAENENGNLEKPNELSGANIVGNEQVVNNNTNDNNVGEQTTGSKSEDRKMTENGGPSETRDNKEIENVGSNSDDSSQDHLKLLKNTTEASTVTHSLSTNGTNKESDFKQSENVTTDGTTSGVGAGLTAIIALGLGSNSSLNSTENQAVSNLTSSPKVEDSDLNSGGTSKTHNGSLSVRPEESVKASKEGGDSSESSTTDTKNIGEATKSEDSSNDGTSNGALETENQEEFKHDLIDASDSSMGLEEKDVRTDLETLPEIQTEGSNDEDAAAE